MPIGRPIANTRIYLLDPDNNLVPVGVPGEIHIGGDGVARGYLNQPELTAEKFIADPFSADAGARLYRTGDLGALLPDGNIVFLGRLDDQVKIRGYRVELGEIEEVLRRHPDVRHGAVALRGDGTEARLCAYVVLRQARAPADDDLRSYLAAHLPSHMMPAAIVRIDQLPLTPTGKVDRARLPMPSHDQLLSPDAPVAPRNEIERRMTALLEEMLGRGPIGVHTDFFSFGGDSLLAIRAAARIKSVFQTEIPVSDVFAHPTAAGLSLVVQNLRAGAHDDRARTPVRVERKADAARGARSHAATIPRRAGGRTCRSRTRRPAPGSCSGSIRRAPPTTRAALWRIDGPLDVAALRAALAAVAAAAAHAAHALRQSPAPSRAGHRRRAAIDLDVVDLSADGPGRGTAPGARRCASARRGRSISQRRRRCAGRCSSSVPAATRCCGSGTTSSATRCPRALLQHELSAAYAAARAGRIAELPALAVDYADYAVWQEDWRRRRSVERAADCTGRRALPIFRSSRFPPISAARRRRAFGRSRVGRRFRAKPPRH